MSFRFTTTLLAVSIATPTMTFAYNNAAFPLKVSNNKRYLVDQNNVPVFVNGDTVWNLMSHMEPSDHDFYFATRAAQGVNSVILDVPAKWCGGYSQSAINTCETKSANNLVPFLVLNNFSQPNPAYFAYADSVIKTAAGYGIQIMVNPFYTGYTKNQDGEGWFTDDFNSKNSVTQLYNYGKYIAGALKTNPNIIWMTGNDRKMDIPESIRAKVDAVARGIHDFELTLPAGQRHLITHHSSPGTSARQDWVPSTQYPADWLTLNATYVYPGSTTILDNDFMWKENYLEYNRSPTMPFVMLESSYEGRSFNATQGYAGTPLQVRITAYQSIFAGAAGHHYGELLVHVMGDRDYTNSVGPWKPYMNTPGTSALLTRKLMESRRWYDLVPDQANEVMTNGFGSGNTYAPTARTADGETVMAYIPDSRTVTINMAKISGPADCWWFNPRDATTQFIGQYINSGDKTFSTPPGGEDWVLVIDDASRNLCVPGTCIYQSTPSTTYTISIVKDGTGSGTITSNQPGLSCNGNSCSQTLPNGSSAVLTATATQGVFSGWSGACSGTGNCTVSSSANIGAIFTLPVSQNVVAQYNFDSGAADSSEGANNGTLVGAPNFVAGKISNAINFNGLNQYVSVPNSSSIETSDSFTIAFWMKRSGLNPLAPSQYETILSKGNGNYVVDMDEPGVNPDNQIGLYVSGKGAIVKSTTGISDTNWHHVAITKFGGVAKIYIDNQDRSSTSQNIAITSNSSPMNIGADIYGSVSSNFFNGALDDLRIYNYALSTEEICVLATGASCSGTITPPPPPPPPLAVVAAVTISPNGGSFSSAQNVSLSSATSGAEIRYTVDGSIPTASSLLYTNPILVGSTQTVKAFALKSGMTASAVSAATFTITLTPPVTPPVGTVAAVAISPADGTYYSRQTISMTSATTGAEIRYTLDGITPTATSTLYTAPFTLSSSKTIKAIALKSGMNNSALSTRILTIKKSPPKGTRIVY